MSQNCFSARFLSVLCLPAWAIFACASEPADLPTEVLSVTQPIIKGEPSGPRQDAVVMIQIGDEGFCSGTLVAPNLVLTARHCVARTDEAIDCAPDGSALEGGKIGRDYAPEDLVIFGTKTEDKQAARPGKLRALARGALIMHDGARNLCNHDLAFLVLDREVAGIKSAPLGMGDSLREGQRVTAVGWGLTAKSELPAVRMQRQDVSILDVGPSRQTSSNHFVVGESICGGDSGGPALSRTGAVMGVVSHGGNGRYNPFLPALSCVGGRTRNVYTRVAGFARLVREAFAEARAQRS
jgi:hypothetical protein